MSCMTLASCNSVHHALTPLFQYHRFIYGSTAVYELTNYLRLEM